MRIELSTKKAEVKEAYKNVELLPKSKYEKDWEIIVEQLIQALNDQNKYTRWGAVGALGEMVDLRAVKPLIETLRDKDWSVRERAVCSLGKIGDRAAVEPLIKVLKEDENSDVREVAKWALKNMGWEPRNDTERTQKFC